MKQLLIGMVILVVVLAGGFAAAIMTLNSIDLSEYEEPISDVVKDSIGRQLNLNGAVNINIGLSPGISVNTVSVQNAGWASRDEMLLVEHVEVHLKLLPLVFGQIELSRLEVVGLDLLLETDQHGKGNWEFEGAGDVAIDSEPEPVSDDETFLTAAVLKKIVIRDAVIVYKDGVSGTVQRFQINELVAKMESAEAPLVIDMRASIGDEPVRLAGGIIGIAGLLSGGPLGLDLTVDILDTTAKVSGNIQDVISQQGIDVAVSVQGDTPADWSGLAGTEIPDLGTYGVTADITGSAEEIHVTNLLLNGGGMQIDGDLKVNIAGELMQLEASFNSPWIDLEKLLPEDEFVESSADEIKSDPEERLFSNDSLPLESMATLDTIAGSVNIAFDELILDSETALTNLNIGLDVAPKAILVKPLSFEALGATVNGWGKLKLVGGKAEVESILDIYHPEAGGLFTDAEATMLTGGQLDLSINVTGRGISVREIMASLNGSLDVEVGAARINNQLVQGAFTGVRSIMNKPGESKPINLHCVTTEIGIRDGIAVPANLVIDTSGLSLFGSGQINLRNETLQLDFDRLADAGSASNALPPFQVRGTLAAPTGGVDSRALAGRALDYGAALAAKSEVEQLEVEAKTGPERCRQRLIVFEQVKKDREQSKDKAIKEATDKATEKAAEKVKGLFDRLLKKRKK